MTRAQLIKGLMILKGVNLNFPPDFKDKAVIDLWHSLLKHIPRKDFLRAIHECAGSCTRFPVPAEIIEAARPTNLLTAGMAWGEVVYQKERCCGRDGVFPVYSSPAIREVVKQMGVSADIEHVTDVKAIMGYSILTTPGLVINEELVFSGRVPTRAEISAFITTAREKE